MHEQTHKARRYRLMSVGHQLGDKTFLWSPNEENTLLGRDAGRSERSVGTWKPNSPHRFRRRCATQRRLPQGLLSGQVLPRGFQTISLPLMMSLCARFSCTLIAVALLTAPTNSAAAETIAGTASVIDGDTIEIHGTRIRLSLATPGATRRRPPSTQAFRPHGPSASASERRGLHRSWWAPRGNFC